MADVARQDTKGIVVGQDLVDFIILIRWYQGHIILQLEQVEDMIQVC